MSVTIQDYIDTLRGGTYKPIAKIEWLRSDESVESVLKSDILGGNLIINRNNGARRACSVNLKGTSDLLPDVYTIWINKKFKLWLGLEINGEEFFMPQGIFVLTNPSYMSSPGSLGLTINGTDKFALLNGELGGTLKDIYQINVGTNVNNAVKTILQDFGDPKLPIVDISAQTFPYDIRKMQDDNVGEMLKEIASFSSRNIYYDENGKLNFVDDIDDDKKGSVWDFNDGIDNFTYLSGNYENLFTEVKNVVKVIGTNVEGIIPEYEAINENPTTGTEVSRIGELVRIEENDYLSTVTECQNLANYILKRTSVLGISGTIACIKMFHLDVDKVVTTTDKNMEYNKKRFLTDSINIGLGVLDEMSISVVTAFEDDFFVGAV